jgi:hypothetical protein
MNILDVSCGYCWFLDFMLYMDFYDEPFSRKNDWLILQKHQSKLVSWQFLIWTPLYNTTFHGNLLKHLRSNKQTGRHDLPFKFSLYALHAKTTQKVIIPSKCVFWLDGKRWKSISAASDEYEGWWPMDNHIQETNLNICSRFLVLSLNSLSVCPMPRIHSAKLMNR